jgi:hypothetical protein
MSEGYTGLPPYYVESSDPLTPNLGLSLIGADPIIANNFVLIDTAIGASSSSVKINGVTVANPNFNNTIPAAPSGNTNVTWQVLDTSVSAYVPSGGSGAVTSVFGRTGAVVANTGDYTVSQITGAAPLSSPAFTGVPISPTPATSDNSNKIATTAYVQAQGYLTSNAVTSVFGRTGAVVAGSTDYSDVANLNLGDGTASVTFGLSGAYEIVRMSNGTATDYITVGNNGTTFYVEALTKQGAGFEALSTASTSSCVLTDASANTLTLGGGTNNFNIQNVAAGCAVKNVTGGNVLSLIGSTVTISAKLALGSNSTLADATGANGTNGQVLTVNSSGNPAWETPATSGTVTSFSAGSLSPLFTTSVATSTTTPALSFALSNAAGGTLFGNNNTTSGAPAYTSSPVLGIPGTSNGSIALSSSTASGLYTIAAPANSATPTLTLPTVSNVLASQLAGDGTIFSSTPLNVASAAGTITLPAPQSQTANTFLAAPNGSAGAPVFRTLVAADIPSGTVLWNNIGNASGSLTLSNGTNGTTFNQTTSTSWNWSNTTAATSGAPQAPPTFGFTGNYWNGTASANDSWTLSVTLAAGTNGNSTFNISHPSGTSGVTAVSIPAGSPGVASDYGLTFSGTTVGLAATGNAIALLASATPTFELYSSTTLEGKITTSATGTLFNSAIIYESGGTGISTIIQGDVTTGANASVLIGQAAAFAATSGAQYGLTIGNGLTSANIGSMIFSPASGTATFTAVAILPTINQTSTSSGNYTGILLNVTETSLKGTANKFMTLQGGATGGTTKYEINNSGIVDNYGGQTTVKNGLAPILDTSIKTAQSAALSATSLVSSTPAAGMWRVSFVANITTAASVSSTLGGTAGFQITFTNGNGDAVSKTSNPTTPTISAANTTGTSISGDFYCYAGSATSITYSFGYTSSGTTAMQYDIAVYAEFLG